jgi:hypothetical protein
VSKLCCPVCWDLLRFMRGHRKTLQVRGRHPIISPVELPPWIPKPLLILMVQVYAGYLNEQLRFMVDNIDSPPGPGHTRDVSGGSECLSDSSTGGNRDGELEKNQATSESRLKYLPSSGNGTKKTVRLPMPKYTFRRSGPAGGPSDSESGSDSN